MPKKKEEKKVKKSSDTAQEKKSERQECEVYSRVVGYIRPVQNWHVGKKAEFKDRKTYDKILQSANS